MAFPVLRTPEAIDAALSEVKAALLADKGSALHGLSPLFAADTLELNPMLPALVERAATLGDCPLFLHLVLNVAPDVRAAATTIQQFGDGIGAIREQSKSPCAITVATIIGVCELKGEDLGSRLDDAASIIVAGSARKVATSTVATLESYYTQGVFDCDVPPTSFVSRGVEAGDCFLRFGA